MDFRRSACLAQALRWGQSWAGWLARPHAPESSELRPEVWRKGATTKAASHRTMPRGWAWMATPGAAEARVKSPGEPEGNPRPKVMRAKCPSTVFSVSARTVPAWEGLPLMEARDSRGRAEEATKGTENTGRSDRSWILTSRVLAPSPPPAPIGEQ